MIVKVVSFGESQVGLKGLDRGEAGDLKEQRQGNARVEKGDDPSRVQAGGGRPGRAGVVAEESLQLVGRVFEEAVCLAPIPGDCAKSGPATGELSGSFSNLYANPQNTQQRIFPIV